MCRVVSCRIVPTIAALAIVTLAGCRGATLPGEEFNAGPLFTETTSELHHVFRVVNTTRKPVKIKDVRASCACTTSRLKKYDLAPGEETELALSATLPKAYQRGELFCTLVTDHPTFPEWEYVVRYEGVPRIIIRPSHVDLGTFKRTDFSKAGKVLSPVDSPQFVIDRFDPRRRINDAEELVIDAPKDSTFQILPDGDSRQVGNGIWHRRYTLVGNVENQIGMGSGSRAKTITVRTSSWRKRKRDGDVARRECHHRDAEFPPFRGAKAAREASLTQGPPPRARRKSIPHSVRGLWSRRELQNSYQ